MEFLMQPINRTLLEEVNDNNSTMDAVRVPVTAPADVETPAPVASSADGQIWREKGAAEGGSTDNAQCSKQSIEQLDPKRCCRCRQGSLRGQGHSTAEDRTGICRATRRHCHYTQDRNKFRHDWGSQ